jgi:hypothetical protein
MAENPKNKGGRPPKTAAEKHSETVRFRVTAAQMQTLQQSAAKSRLTLSEYARQMVLAGKVIAPASPEELGLIAELTREKNNLNQLAKAQNAAGAAKREAELIRIIRFYNRMIAKLKRE